MKLLNNCFPYHELEGIEHLKTNDKELVQRSIEAAKKAYAPYSKFKVGAALRLENTIIVEGSNQENLSFPEGLCAERVVIHAAAHRFGQVAGDTLAIAAMVNNQLYPTPVSPCGGCRQVMAEYIQRHQKPLRLILCGSEKVLIIENALYLLPLSFNSQLPD